jgi:Winged helix DNA-binding domain
VTPRSAIVERRLRSHRLSGTPFDDAAAAVRWFGAVQSQDYNAATWAVGMRTADATRSAVDAAVDSGMILRTHVLRPTWHFVHRDDARWLLALSGPRVLKGIAGRLRRLELDAATIARALDVFSNVLTTTAHSTRSELGGALRTAGIAPDGQRLPHLLMIAELEARIISGPMRRNDATYALFEHRATPSGPQELDEQLAELARRYFRSHGPAQVHDFAWWGGLTTRDAQRGMAAVGPALQRTAHDGSTYWFSEVSAADAPRSHVHLLANFDEYTVAYRDRSVLLHPRHPIDVTQLAFGSVLSNVVLDQGLVVAAWRRAQRGASMLIEVRCFGPLSSRTRDAVTRAADQMSAFLGTGVAVSWPQD